jgi:hypothetical protein
MQSVAVLKREAKKAIDDLSGDRLRVVVDFIGYLKSREKRPNKTTLETFRKSDGGKELTTYKSLDDFFKEMGA